MIKKEKVVQFTIVLSTPYFPFSTYSPFYITYAPYGLLQFLAIGEKGKKGEKGNSSFPDVTEASTMLIYVTRKYKLWYSHLSGG